MPGRGTEQQERDGPGGEQGQPASRPRAGADALGTPAGQAYARAVTAVIRELNREVAERAGQAQLVAADAVLRAALFDESARQRASRLPRPADPGDSAG